MVVDEKQLTEDILRLAATDVSRCMQCGRCSANCEAASKMDLLPHRVVWDLNSGYASELLEALYGEHGRHARSAIGVGSLPTNASVEIEIIAEKL